jgi:tRNA pseudouridine38-40 synthase
MYRYLFRIQYLGFRFHGWQVQPAVKTIQSMIHKTFDHIDNTTQWKTIGCGRTDRMVSANDFAFMLIADKEIEPDRFFPLFNENLPQDIRALSIQKISNNFRIINDVKKKEYVYLFSYGEKAHPFCAPLMTNYLEDLDIESMIAAAKEFEGEHNFQKFCYKPGENKQFVRTIDTCEIQKNTLYTANFFPENSYLLRIIGSGFMRHQVRMIMGYLFDIGRGKESVVALRKALAGLDTAQHETIAPQSGLIVQSLELDTTRF